MKCHECENEARGLCKFCGRAVCPAHAKAAVYCSGYGKKNKNGLLSSGSDTGVVVHNALKCSACKVEYQRTY